MAAALVPPNRNVSPVHLCHLCGTKTRTKLCEGCFNRYFCDGCYERYHTHPKRKGHNRGWTCSFCTLNNPARTKICQACAKTDIHHLEKTEGSKAEVRNEGLVLKKVGNAEDAEDEEGWSCTFCTLINQNAEKICKVCAKTRLEEKTEEKSSLKRKHDSETDVVYQKRIRRFQAENNIETREEAEEKYQSLPQQSSSANYNNNTNELCLESPEVAVPFGSALKNDADEGSTGSECKETSMDRKNTELKTENFSLGEDVKVRGEPEMVKDELAVHFVSASKKDEIGNSAETGNNGTWMEMKNLEKWRENESREDENAKVEVRDEAEVIEDEKEEEESEEIKDETEKDVPEVTMKMANLTLSEKGSSELSREETKPLLYQTSSSISGAPNDVSPITQNHSRTDETRNDNFCNKCCCHIL